MPKYILALDQGTTSSRALVIDTQGRVLHTVQKEFPQYFPKSGWVEHDPQEIWETQSAVLQQAVKGAGVQASQIAAIGITNQRETTIVWDKNTGEPIYPAIVWQDTRTSDYCRELSRQNLGDLIQQKTGLIIDSYFSGTKIKWILDEVPGARQKAERGELCFGTIDCWLVWKMTKGQVHATDFSNASRTMLYNIHDLEWDLELLNILDIPATMLPEVQPSAHIFGEYQLDGVKIPIAGIAGDQQAALFGQACFEHGMAKNTYGTGCFMLMNTGPKPVASQNGLLTTIAWGLNGEVHYALEGSVFIAGAAIQWLRDGLRLIDEAKDAEYFARKIADQFDVFVVPAFAGLGAPYWDMYARGAIFGLTRDTGKAQLIKATLESLAYQTKDVLEAMERDSGLELKTLKVDGGATANDYLMQFQADLLNAEVERPSNVESTAMGAAFLAGIQTEIWQPSDILDVRSIDKTFQPLMHPQQRQKLYKRWQKAVERTKDWLE